MRLPRSMGRRVLFLGCYGAFVIGVLWFGCRLYWTWKLGVPLVSTVRVWDHYYPELRLSGALNADIKSDDDTIDVLMLGASTIERGWGDVEARLKAGLQREFGDRVRIFNLAMVAHTSRDSLLKFSQVAQKPFDLILIYDGFNDCRMNNCPRELFRKDYTHCTWYQGFEKRRLAGSVNLPMELMGDMRHLIDRGQPDDNLVQYGGDLKTPEPFTQNLEEIVKTSQPHSLVLLQTFAFHIPDNYSDDLLKQGKLDYGSRQGATRCGVEMWGKPANVIKCVTAHNQQIRKLAERYPQRTVFIDQNRLIPHDKHYFVDGCHFTDDGCRKFVDNLLPAVIQHLRRTRAR